MNTQNNWRLLQRISKLDRRKNEQVLPSRPTTVSSTPSLDQNVPKTSIRTKRRLSVNNRHLPDKIHLSSYSSRCGRTILFYHSRKSVTGKWERIGWLMISWDRCLCQDITQISNTFYFCFLFYFRFVCYFFTAIILYILLCIETIFVYLRYLLWRIFTHSMNLNSIVDFYNFRQIPIP